MPVDSQHDEYRMAASVWARLRDVLDGHDAMVAGGTRYLARLEGQVPEEYHAYQQRAAFVEATSRTVEGLAGAIFRKPVQFTTPPAFDDLVSKFSNRGVSGQVFVKEVVNEVLSMGRYGVLVDIDGLGQTYAAGYTPEDIINWREIVVDGHPRLSLVVLREERISFDDDPFEGKKIKRIRVLALTNEEGRAVYTQRVFEKQVGENKREAWVLVEESVPTMRGTPLDFIPFTFFAPDNLDPAVARSPINGLALANISHWRTSADLKHGAHFTALPTPWIAGDIQGGDQSAMSIGSGVAWHLLEGSQVGMLEFTGAGLAAVRQIREDEKQDMAVLGARLLEDQKSGVEAAATVMLRHRGENSVLANISDAVSRGMTRVLQTMVWWAGGPAPEFMGGPDDQVKVKLNSDFVEKALTPQEMVQLIAGWQQGGYGGEVLFTNLRDGERLPEGMDFEAWLRDIEENGPAAQSMGSFGPEEAPEPPEESEEPEEPIDDADIDE
jgi:hypothetical protein